MKNFTIGLDSCWDSSNQKEAEEKLSHYNLKATVLDSIYENLIVEGSKEDILKFLLDSNGYGVSITWIREFYPELCN